MKVAMTVIGVIICLLLFGTMIGGITDAQTDERTDTFISTTGIGETTDDVVLVSDIFDDNLNNVVSITSNNSDDAPLPDTWVGASNTLTVRGLNADDTRTLTIIYKYDNLDNEPVQTFFWLIPLLVAVALVLVLVAVGIAAIKNR